MLVQEGRRELQCERAGVQILVKASLSETRGNMFAESTIKYNYKIKPAAPTDSGVLPAAPAARNKVLLLKEVL